MPEKPLKASVALRKRAERLLKSQAGRLQELTSSDFYKLVQELGTHQIELEMQNEELRRAQQELESSRRRYAELYDFSPVAYLTLDQKGVIREVNHTGGELLGVNKLFLIGRPFTIFVDRAYRRIDEAHRTDMFRYQVRQTCELKLKPRNAAPFHARLQSVYAESAEYEPGVMRTALVDISDRERAKIEREKLILELQEALTKVHTLSGLLPICAWCKKIRNDKGYWEQVEVYIAQHAEISFTHGMCPECLEKQLAEGEGKKYGRRAGDHVQG